MERAFLVWAKECHDNLVQLNTLFTDGWRVKMICPMSNPAGAAGGNTYSAFECAYRFALVILEKK